MNLPQPIGEQFIADLAKAYGLNFAAGACADGRWAVIESPGVPGDAVLYDFRDGSWNDFGTWEKIPGAQVTQWLERHDAKAAGTPALTHPAYPASACCSAPLQGGPVVLWCTACQREIHAPVIDIEYHGEAA